MEKQTILVMVPNEELLDIKKQLEYLRNRLDEKNSLGKEENSEWLDSEAARQLLGVSAKTWQEYRNRRYFPFAQIGRKIYVKREELNKFMERHTIY